MPEPVNAASRVRNRQFNGQPGDGPETAMFNLVLRLLAELDNDGPEPNDVDNVLVQLHAIDGNSFAVQWLTTQLNTQRDIRYCQVTQRVRS